MEWMTEIINFIKEVNWALSLIAAIPLAVIANLLTPKVANWLGSKSVEKAKRRIADLQEELKKVYDLAHDPIMLSHENNIALFKVLGFIAIGSAMDFFGVLAIPLGAVFHLSAFMMALKHISLLRNCQNFKAYESKTTDYIEKLEEQTSNKANAADAKSGAAD